MTGMLIAASGTAFILLLGEYLWQKRILKGEYARKFVHILAATYAASWPFFISRISIALLSVIFILSLVIIKKTGLFKSMHSIKRATYGEIWYAVGIGVLALVFRDNLIYAVAVLHMALADGFAAIVGVSLNKNAKKFVFNGYTKSIAGSFTFLLISFLLNIFYWTVVAHPTLVTLNLSPALYSLISAMALSLAEIVSPKGSDNIIVPALAGLLLWLPALF